MYFNHVFAFSFSYVYIPILPAHLVEVLNSPTPYMAGVHSSLTEDTADLVSDNNLQILNSFFLWQNIFWKTFIHIFKK